MPTEETEIKLLWKRIQVLEEALRPFADASERLIGYEYDAVLLAYVSPRNGEPYVLGGLTVAELRRAAAALAGKQN